jgi:GTPase SAR1 family protein
VRRAIGVTQLSFHRADAIDTCITGDVGGQRTLRPYWRNYFERTDAVVWVVDSGDVERLRDCKEELWNLLGEEVRAKH